MIALLNLLPRFIAALPAFLELVLKLMNVVITIVEWAHKKDVRLWMENLEVQIDKLDQAKTPEDKRMAARGLSRILRDL